MRSSDRFESLSDQVSWGGHGAEQGVDDVLAAHVLGLRLEGQQHAVAEHEVAEAAHILRDHIRAPGEQGQRAGRVQEGDGSAGGLAPYLM